MRLPDWQYYKCRSIFLRISIGGRMRKSFILSAVTTVLAFIASANGQTATQIYSFEASDTPNNLDGFGPNQGGTVFSSTIGATSGTGSLGYSMLSSDTFTGILTQDLPVALNSAETEEINFDLTIPATGQYTGTFADIGIAEFGTNVSQGFSSYPVFTAQGNLRPYQNIDLAPGTYNMSIPLITGVNPLTGEGPVPLSNCFGPDPDTQLTLTGFEFYISKNNDDPLTIYIDNVKAQPLLGDTNDDFQVDSTDLDTVMANMGKTVTGGFADGDFNGDGVVNADDFALYEYGAAQYNFLEYQPLPEPACMAIVGGGVLLAARRRRK
jgi:hypothetical protein